MAQIICRDLSLGYEGKTVTENLSFEVCRGDYLCIVGKNGSGKTTLMKALLRQKSLLSGEIIYSDGFSPKEIGYLPQKTQSEADFPASVREVVLSGCINRAKFKPFYSRDDKERALAILDRLSISSIRNARFSELSGGQQQRVLLARALCATRQMLLLDEPVSGLDPVISAELYKIVEELNRHDGISVIMISHDIHAAMKYASHILHLEQTPLFFGTKHDYVHSGLAGCFCSHDHDHSDGGKGDK